MRTVYCKGCVPPCRLRTSPVKAVSSTTVAPRVRTLWKIFLWTVRWESPKERNVGREQWARWRCARPLAPLHACPAAGVICGTARAHRGVRLQKDPLKSSCQVRVEVSPCCVELHSRRSCCVSHQRVKMSVLLLRIKSAVPTALRVFFQVPHRANPGFSEPWDTARRWCYTVCPHQLSIVYIVSMMCVC